MIRKVKIHGYRIYKDFALQPNQKLNLIVGANESGKSTLMEAVTLALTGRINGRKASEELNPYWFNKELVEEFVRQRHEGNQIGFPEIRIELFLEDRADLQQLCGAINTEVPTTACPGVSIRVIPNPDYTTELEDWAQQPSPILPVEYYMVDWRSFADAVLTNRPKQLATAVIDSRTIKSNSGVDYHLRQILNDHLEPDERAQISLAYRRVKESMSEGELSSVNERISELHGSLHDRPIALAMDQSSRSSWEDSVTPHVEDVPFSMAGQGQQAAIKISLAMNRHSGKAKFIMVEEPENHLTHTSLTALLSRMESLSGEEQQLFVTTHSSFVLNRLGLGSLLLIGRNDAPRIPDLRPGTASYFQKLPGYDTLRMALAKSVVLVEGPSDEIIFERVFFDMHGKRPMECGVDVLSMRGLSLARCLELCAALDKTVAALRDNDGVDPMQHRNSVADYLCENKRQLFVGEVRDGKTLEPQLITFNGEDNLRKILDLRRNADLLTWMTREKTEAAIRIAGSSSRFAAPAYMRKAAEFING